MDFRGCQGCHACKTGKETCILKDDLEAVLKEIEETDVLVVSAPVYFMDIPGQVKCFFDRFSSFLKPRINNEFPQSRLSEGKKAIFVQTQGADESMFKNVYEKYQQIFGLIGFSEVHTIRATDFIDPDQEINPDILNEAEKLALSFV